MSRVIQSENGAAERNRMCRAIVLSLRELMQQTEPDDLSLDLAAFISLALQEIQHTVDVSANAWEKRGYWLKADRFRMEWEWSQELGVKFQQAVLEKDWGNIAMLSAKLAQKLAKTRLPQRNRLGTPWVGAWDKLIARNS